ncbi:ATP-dependent DNA helicase RecG [soil metagenome]
MEPAAAIPADAPTLEPPRAIGSGESQDRQLLGRAPLRSRSHPSRLAVSITTLKGAGPKLSALAAKLGVATVGDLLWHIPHSYGDRREPRGVGELKIGEEATVLAEVKSIKVRPTRRRGLKIVEARLRDETGLITAIWFNQAWLADRLPPGTRVLAHGKFERSGFKVGAYEIADQSGRSDGIHTTGVVPAHPATDGLTTQKIREWVFQALPQAVQAIEPLPAALRIRRKLPGIADSLTAIQFPADLDQVPLARQRLALEELILHQFSLAARRRGRDVSRPGIALPSPTEVVERWLASLPFVPTDGQRAAFAEVDRDLAGPMPMQRLLMGEVGSGKTVVAVYAMLRAVEHGYQAALMAPTETLAEQHAITLDRLLADAGVSFTLLTGSTRARGRREALGRLASGELQIVIGTHALIEPDVEFSRLGVCVVDEQHRFGVDQRSSLDAKGPVVSGARAAPHVLHMTATPIPRTLSLTAYGDLDTTTLRELPAGRKPVKTWIVSEEKRAGAYEFVRERLREGRQAFFVCPLVERSEKLEGKAAAEEAERLATGEMRDFSVALIHGQMHASAKAAAMERFASGDADVLVATTVIEVGIDVPNATVMVIEGAERYGISQLHQLRGRVGRGEHESYCLLFGDTGPPMARERLRAIERERDGFKLAEVDLTLRGEGEVLGTRQSGLPRYRVAELPEDEALLVEARREVLDWLAEHERFDVPELGPLLDAARLRFGDEREAIRA